MTPPREPVRPMISLTVAWVPTSFSSWVSSTTSSFLLAFLVDCGSETAAQSRVGKDREDRDVSIEAAKAGNRSAEKAPQGSERCGAMRGSWAVGRGRIARHIASTSRAHRAETRRNHKKEHDVIVLTYHSSFCYRMLLCNKDLSKIGPRPHPGGPGPPDWRPGCGRRPLQRPV